MEIVTEGLDRCLIDVLNKYESCFNSNLGLQNLQQIKFENSTKAAVSNLLLMHLLKVESLSAGAADLMLQFLFNKDKKKDEVGICQKLDSSLLKRLLSSYVDKSLEDLVNESLNLAGLTGKVVLIKQRPQQDKDVLELNDGSFFSDVISILKLKNSKYLNPRIVCIDGYIESVSEIHRILEDASNLKENVFLFVRGISDDVAHTLKVNYDRGTLSVLPFIVNYDLDGVNLLNDIAVVSGGDVTSSLKGQLINNIDISCAPRVDYISTSDSGVLIENVATKANVDQHINFLQKKLLELDQVAAKDLISKRIKNLGSNRVTISLRIDQNISKRSFMIDRALRATKIASTHGVVEVNDRLYPLTSFTIAKLYCQQFLNEYRNLGTIISI